MIQVNFRFERYWWFCLLNFWNFHTIRVFEVRESIADISTELLCLSNLENPGKLPVQDALGGTCECACFIDFQNFLTIHVFGVKDPIADISTELPCLDDLENPGWLPVQHVPWWLCLIDFWNFFTIHVFEVSEQRTIWWHSYTELLCLEDLKNSGHILVQEVFEVTQTFVPWLKSSKFISSRAKVAGRSHDQRFIVNFVVMSRNVTSCHVMPRYATSCHVMLRHATSSHVMLRHVT